MATYETLKKKADALLKLGDSLGKTNPAESRRILRKCCRYRLLARKKRPRAARGEKGNPR